MRTRAARARGEAHQKFPSAAVKLGWPREAPRDGAPLRCYSRHLISRTAFAIEISKHGHVRLVMQTSCMLCEAVPYLWEAHHRPRSLVVGCSCKLTGAYGRREKYMLAASGVAVVPCSASDLGVPFLQ